VRLLAVSKGHPAEACAEALECGQRDLGENYAQELQAKAAVPSLAGVSWHFIGRLQTNKAKLVAATASAVHSVDRLELGLALSKARPAGAAALRLFVQVALAGEAQKGGCEPSVAGELVERLGDLPGLQVVGLMTVPPLDSEAEANRRYFTALRELKQAVASGLPERLRAPFTELSMGMSSDLEVAIDEGATWVRVGTDIFGPRAPMARQ
jgi:hypothetical protein